MNRVKNRKTRFILIPFVVVIAITAILLGILSYNFPSDYMRDVLLEKAKASLGCRITVEKFDMTLRGIFLRNITISRGEEGNGGIIATAESARIGYSLVQLLKKKFHVKRLTITNSVLNVAFDKSGTSNLDEVIERMKKKSGDDESFAGISRITLQKAIVNIMNPREPLKPLEGKYEVSGDMRIDGEIVHATRCTLTLPDGRGILRPRVNFRTDEGNKFVITGEVDMERASLLWVYRWADSPLPYKTVWGKINDLRITPESVSGRVTAESTLSNSPIILTASGLCTVSVGKRTVALSGIEARMEKSSMTLRELLLTFNGDILLYDTEKFDMALDHARLLMGAIPQKVFGRVRGSLKMAGGSLNGTLRLSHAGYDGKSPVLSGINTGIKIVNNTFREENISLKIMNNPCALSLASADGKMDQLFANVRCKGFTLSGKEIQYDESPSADIPFNLAGEIHFAGAELMSLPFRDFTVNYSIMKNRIEVKRFSLKFLDGVFTGSGSVDMSKKPYRGNLKADFHDVRAQNLGQLNQNLSGRIYGVAGGTLNVTFPMTAGLLKSMTGRTELSINNGKLVNTGIQNGLGIWLTELKYKLKDLEFKRISGNFSVRNEDVYVNSFLLNSENIRLRMRGKIDTSLRADNMSLDLEFTKNFINDLPTAAVAISLNRYLQGGWYVIPFMINGDIMEKNNIKKATP